MNAILTKANRDRVQQFLQLNYLTCFSLDYLHRHLEIPLAEVEAYCEALDFIGAVFHPSGTNYVQGVAVDWRAVHEGRAVRPDWSKHGSL